ncbi:hypothetical protein IEO21_06849 [Rhodonia placenta]|uniref:Uncharacterized protein n=1 Tax=Rhodonia placenta TaxID=104341 RepID=A0A8H7NZ56_9APHY|nr:hypothetical protein IEO21_06849 [Postia placenta]
MTAIPSQSIGPITRPPIPGRPQHPAPPSQNKNANSPPRTREIAPPKMEPGRHAGVRAPNTAYGWTNATAPGARCAEGGAARSRAEASRTGTPSGLRARDSARRIPRRSGGADRLRRTIGPMARRRQRARRGPVGRQAVTDDVSEGELPRQTQKGDARHWRWPDQGEIEGEKACA